MEQEYDDYVVTGECQPCDMACVGGCSGPLGIATSDGGCNKCDKILLNQNGSQVRCYSDVVFVSLNMNSPGTLSDKHRFMFERLLQYYICFWHRL